MGVLWRGLGLAALLSAAPRVSGAQQPEVPEETAPTDVVPAAPASSLPAASRPWATVAVPSELVAASRARTEDVGRVAVAATGVAWPESLRPAVDEALRLRAAGSFTAATLRFVGLYDRLAAHPRRHLDALNAIASDAVNTAALAHRRDRSVEAVCAAQGVLVRHAARVAALERTTPAFTATLATVAEELDARLAARGESCPGRPPARGDPGPEDMLLAPGRLRADLEVREVEGARRRWNLAARGGLVMMATGMMVLGGGLAIGAADQLPRRDTLQAWLFVSGTALFVGGFPLLVIGEQRTRATLAAGPSGVAVGF